MVRRTFSLSILAAALLLIPTSFASLKMDGVHPLTMRTSSFIAGPGDTVQFTVTLSGPAEGDEVIEVNTPSGAFSAIPLTVTPQPGNYSVTVTGTLSQNPGPWVMVEASTEEATVGTTIYVAESQDGSHN